MRMLRLVSFSFVAALVCSLSAHAIGRHLEESSQDRKIDEICAVITEEVQTGSMSKAIESARTLFSFTFPDSKAFVQIKEHNTAYGVVPSDASSSSYRRSQCEIEARSDAAVLFFILREELVSRSLFYWAVFLGTLFAACVLGFSWLARKISIVAQRRFNLELQTALGLSTDKSTGGLVSRILESVVKGAGSGKNLRKSVQNLKEKILEQNREAIALREAQMATELELKKNEKFIEVVRQVRHDIRSPLQVLTVLSEADIASSVAHRQMSSVISSIHGMIEDLEIKEEMADISGNGERLHVAEALIKEVIQQKRLLFERTRLELKINSDLLSVVRVQPHHFRRVIGNLLQNAFEAIDPRATHGLIRVETEKQGQTLHIRITDNGKGISNENKDKLFSPGFTFGKEHGSGLGLSHAKSCIHRWGGDIGLTSESGKGTTVELSLPIAVQDTLFVAQPPLSQARVNVVVDDDPEDFMRVQRSLASPSVYCASLEDFDDWRAATRDQAGVQFVFDYNLGGDRSGLEVLRAVSSELPRILSTSDYDRQDVIEASQDGIYVLPKVFLI